MASIEYDIDRARRRVVIRFAGEVDGRMLNAAMARLWEEFPAIGGSDSICDMREFVGNIGFDDIRDVAQAWARFTAGADRGRRTAIVTYDRFAHLLVQAIKPCFIGRELALFRSLEEAGNWLDERTGRQRT